MAPEMLILDGKHNGYRNLILPIALEDRMVRQAVCSVVGLHIWRSNPDLYALASESRAKVIQQLKEASNQLATDRVFSISTWVTLMVLLLGELVLGGDHYTYLLRMMCSMKARSIDGNAEILGFLSRQTDM